MATRLYGNYDREVQKVRESVLSYAERSWNSLGSYRDADAKRLIAKLVPRVEAGQLRIAQLTDAYIARLAAQELGAAVKRGPVADVSTKALRGVPVEEVYRRPFASTYTSLSEGASVTAAISAGGARLTSLVSTGMQLAKTHSARQAMSRTSIETYRRVLTGRENCALCVIASTQRYWKKDLLPIHPGCDCGIDVNKGNPDEQVIQPDLLEEIHGAVEAQFGGTDRGARMLTGDNPISDFLDLIVTREHSELGPVLVWRHQKFTSAADIGL